VALPFWRIQPNPDRELEQCPCVCHVASPQIDHVPASSYFFGFVVFPTIGVGMGMPVVVLDLARIHVRNKKKKTETETETQCSGDHEGTMGENENETKIGFLRV
jgi:hypothetical protein